MSDLSQRIAALPLEKRALLEQQFKALQAANTAPPIPTLPDNGPSRLSFAQERLWFLSRFEPDDYSFNEPSAWRLTGALDAGLLREALCAVVARHEVLRTVYRLEEGIPLQAPLAGWDLPLEQVDLSGLPPDTRLTAAKAAFPEVIARPFDLETDLMLRTTLFRLAADDHVLLLIKHHIACDGWSGRLLVAEMTEIYTAQREGRSPSLPELPVQYRDYAAWQRDWVTSDALRPQLDYWRNQLDALTPLEIPADRPLGARLSARGDSEFFDLASRSDGTGERPQRRVERHALHDAAHGLRAHALSLFRAGRRRPGHDHRKPPADADRAPDRPVHQHPGAPREPGGRPDGARTDRTRAQRHPRRLRSPGHPLRAAAGRSPTRTATPGSRRSFGR